MTCSSVAGSGTEIGTAARVDTMVGTVSAVSMTPMPIADALVTMTTITADPVTMAPVDAVSGTALTGPSVTGMAGATRPVVAVATLGPIGAQLQVAARPDRVGLKSGETFPPRPFSHRARHDVVDSGSRLVIGEVTNMKTGRQRQKLEEQPKQIQRRRINPKKKKNRQ